MTLRNSDRPIKKGYYHDFQNGNDTYMIKLPAEPNHLDDPLFVIFLFDTEQIKIQKQTKPKKSFTFPAAPPKQITAPKPKFVDSSPPPNSSPIIYDVDSPPFTFDEQYLENDDCIYIDEPELAFEMRTTDEPVGLRNQGATCYLNSLIQALFCLPIFRQRIYDSDSDESFVKALQDLFAALQLGRGPASTKYLTDSFGWGIMDILRQQDAQEFCRKLMDKLDPYISFDIFKGRSRSFFKCTEVDYETENEEEFLDLSLVVKDCPTLEASFDNYISLERLDGVNRIAAGPYGLQEGIMGVDFVQLPPILFVHLRRFEYEMGHMSKVNSQFAFPAEIDLTHVLASNNRQVGRPVYQLFGVLVHSGTAESGHYYAMLRPTLKPDWYKFNDSYVSSVDQERVFADNFGDKSYSAYMLVYCQKDNLGDIFCPTNVPQSIVDRLKKTHFQQEAADIEIRVASFTTLHANAVNLKVGLQKHCHPLRLAVSDQMSLGALVRLLASQFKMPAERARLWYCNANYGIVGPVNKSNKVSDLTHGKLFLEKMKRNDYDGVDNYGKIAHLYLFMPHQSTPLHYLLSVILDSNMTVKDAGMIVLKKIKVGLGIDLNAYCSFGYQEFEPVPMSALMNDLPFFAHGMSLIFEGVIAELPMVLKDVKPEADNTVYHRRVYPDDTPADFLTYIQVKEMRLTMKWRDQFRYVVAPRQAPVDVMMLMLLAQAIGKEYSCSDDTLLLFAKHSARPMVIFDDDNFSDLIVKSHGELKIKLFKHIPPEAVSDMRMIKFTMSQSIFHTKKKLFKVASPQATVHTFVTKAVCRGMIDLPPTRIYGIKDRRIVATFSQTDRIGEGLDIIRAEFFDDPNIPSDHDQFVQVINCSIRANGDVEERGQPFLFKLIEDETLETFRQRLEPRLQITEGRLKCLRYFVVQDGKRKILEDKNIVDFSLGDDNVLFIQHLGRPINTGLIT